MKKEKRNSEWLCKVYKYLNCINEYKNETKTTKRRTENTNLYEQTNKKN